MSNLHVLANSSSRNKKNHACSSEAALSLSLNRKSTYSNLSIYSLGQANPYQTSDQVYLIIFLHCIFSFFINDPLADTAMNLQ